MVSHVDAKQSFVRSKLEEEVHIRVSTGLVGKRSGAIVQLKTCSISDKQVENGPDKKRED